MEHNTREFYETCIKIAAIFAVFCFFELSKALDIRIKVPSTSFIEILIFCILFILLVFYEFNANDIRYKIYMHKYSKKKRKVVYFDPPKNISPAVVGLLCDGKVDFHDITCLIYNWAAHGIVSIETATTENGINISHNGKPVVILRKLNDLPDDAPMYEKAFFNSTFTGSYKIKKITCKEQLTLKDDIACLENYVIKMGWMSMNFNKFSLLALILTIIFSIICIFYKWIYLLLFSFYLIDYLRRKIYKTKLHLEPKGINLFLEIIGYKQFIKHCDEKQIKFYLEQDPLFVDKTLPYAIAFGLKTEFLGKITPSTSKIKKIWGKDILESIF